jgi:phosphonate transport system substrate-binding protein
VPALIFATGPSGLEASGERARGLFATLLSRALGGAAVETRAALTYSELLGWVGRGEVHAAWLGPALFVHAHARFGAVPVVRLERHGHATFRGCLFVRDASELRSLEDLRGKRIAWVDPDSCAGFLFPRIALAQRGHDPDALFGDLRILGSHGAVVRAVADGSADVGASYVELEDPEDASSPIARAAWTGASVAMRPLLITDPVPGDVIVTSRAIDAALRAKITRALESLDQSPEGADVLRTLFQAARAAPVSADDYAPVRDALRAAGVRV